mmetsp:Transcript_7849/g.12932  ORF Transcript_7849/g.12932 Transcript_7849/m.12932 type:complete len:133 (+) Transcript_7849:1279-1677(+)
MPRIFTFSFMGDVSPAPRPAHVQPTERGSVAGPLQNISNTKVPTTEVLNEGKTNLLKPVSSQWRSGKGRSQTPKCLAAIRICLGFDISPDDIAKYVANTVETDVQAIEFKRARDCAKRISKSMWKGTEDGAI